MHDDFGQRAFWAHRALEQRLRRDVSQEELGERVGKRLGKGPIHQSTAGKWIKPGGSVPDVATIAAIAAELGVDPGWLAFGSRSEAPAPPQYVTPVRTPTRKEPPMHHGEPVRREEKGKGGGRRAG